MFPGLLDGLTKLKVLDLINNHLYEIHDSVITDLISLQMLFIDNPIFCCVLSNKKAKSYTNLFFQLWLKYCTWGYIIIALLFNLITLHFNIHYFKKNEMQSCMIISITLWYSFWFMVWHKLHTKILFLERQCFMSYNFCFDFSFNHNVHSVRVTFMLFSVLGDQIWENRNPVLFQIAYLVNDICMVCIHCTICDEYVFCSARKRLFPASLSITVS